MHHLRKQFTVFGVNDSLYGSTQYLDSVFLQYTFLVKLYTAVQSRLTSERQHNGIRMLLNYHLLNKFRSDRQIINKIRNTLGSLNGSHIRIYQYSKLTLLMKSLQGL